MISGAKPSSSPTCSIAPHERSGGLSSPTAPAHREPISLQQNLANGSLASSPPRRRLARGDLEDDGSIGCADVSTARGIGDRSLLPVPPQRSPNDRRLARPQEPARPAREPNPCSFACSLIGETP